MLVTLFGIVIEVRLRQLWKTPSPMLVTLFGIVTDVRPVQPSKAFSPMLVTLFGIVISPVAAAKHANNSVFVASR